MDTDTGRRKVVLVVGDGRHPHHKKSAAVGEWIAGNDWHLLTGGGAGVMRSVTQAFRDSQKRGIAIGIIPGTTSLSGGMLTHRTKDENYPNPLIDVAIFTHLPGEDPEGESSRNHINVLSADLVIALPGGPGTLAEVRLAKKYGKPVVAYLSEGESIHGCSAEQLANDGFRLVQTFRELVDVARSILLSHSEIRRKSLRIPLSRCTLRLWSWDDAESLQHHASNRKVSRNLLDQFPYPYSALDAERWLSWDQPSGTVFAIDVGGKAVGGIGFVTRPEDPVFVCEIGYWLGEQFWGRGIATESLCAVTAYAFASNPELHRITAHVFPWNKASMRVLEKAGYTREGVLHGSTIKEGKFVDEVIYATLRDGKS